MHPFSAMILASGAITFTARDGQSHTILRENPRYEEAKEALAQINQSDLFGDDADEQIALLVSIAQPIKAIERESDGKVTIREGVVYYQDERGETALHNVVADRILYMLNEGFDAKPMITFLGFLQENPSYRSVNDVFRFMEKNRMGITPDGHILAYKKVRDDYTDIHSGTFDNHPGQKPFMRRNEVEDNPDITCSSGLHVCSYSYLPQFGSSSRGDRVVVCKVNPRDVVSVPTDYNDAKMRVCEYEVLYEVKGYTQNDVLSSAPVSDEDGTFSGRGRERPACPNCGDRLHYSNDYCSACGYEDDPAEEDENNSDDDAAVEREAMPYTFAKENPPVIEFKDQHGDWKVLQNHGCSTRQEAENYVAALGDTVRLQPTNDPQPATEWPLAKQPVDLRNAVDGVQQAVSGLYGPDAQVDVNMSLDGDGGLKVHVRPQALPDDPNRAKVEAGVKRIIIDHLGVEEDKVTPDAHLIDDLGADSLDIVELVMAAEEEFVVEIPDDERCESDITVQQVVDLLLSKISHPL